MRFLWIFLLFIFSQLDGAISWTTEELNGITAQIQLSHEEISVDEPFEMRITLHAPETVELDSLTLRNQILDDINVVSEQFSLKEEEIERHQIKYTLVPKVPGSFYMNLLTIPIIRGDVKFSLLGRIEMIHVTSSIDVEKPWKLSATVMAPREYASVGIDPENVSKWIRGKKYLEKLALHNATLFPDRTWIWIAAFSTFILIALVALYYREFRQKITSLLHPKKDPQDQALFDLKQSDLPIEKVGDIVRQYLSESHELPLSYRTTTEILTSFTEQKAFSESSIQDLDKIFRHTDLVKFSKFQPHEKTKSDVLDTARNFIQSH